MKDSEFPTKDRNVELHPLIGMPWKAHINENFIERNGYRTPKLLTIYFTGRNGKRVFFSEEKFQEKATTVLPTNYNFLPYEIILKIFKTAV